MYVNIILFKKGKPSKIIVFAYNPYLEMEAFPLWATREM